MENILINLWIGETEAMLANIAHTVSNNEYFIPYIDAYLQTQLIFLNGVGKKTGFELEDRFELLKKLENRYLNKKRYMIKNDIKTSEISEKKIIKQLKDRTKDIKKRFY